MRDNPEITGISDRTLCLPVNTYHTYHVRIYNGLIIPGRPRDTHISYISSYGSTPRSTSTTTITSIPSNPKREVTNSWYILPKSRTIFIYRNPGPIYKTTRNELYSTSLASTFRSIVHYRRNATFLTVGSGQLDISNRRGRG